MSRPAVPQYHELMWPALQATQELGGSATVSEMNEWVIANEGFSEEVQAVPHGDGRMSELEYRLHWARTHLKGIGAMDNSARGVWAVTDHGSSLTEEQMHAETKAWRDELRLRRQARRAEVAEEDEGVTDGSWKDALIARLLELPSEGFERSAHPA